ncbi:MAG: ABC transporter substrate-binding protein [Lachnospiraceae bacterium]|nr:ABC transporter substrate-binding protein [Lachnospiraceae bacterium]
MKRRIVITLLTTALTVSLAACGNKTAVAPADNSSTDAVTVADTATEEAPSSEEASEETKEPVALRAVAYNSIVAHLDSVIAKEAGYYEEEGLDVTMNYNNSNPDNIQALLEDKLDLVSAGSTAVLNFIDQGADIVIIGGQMTEGVALYSLPERADEFKEINEASLAGKKVGVTRMQTGDIALRKILKDQGADLSKIEFVELDSPATIIEAVKKGEVDIGSLYMTFRETAELQGLTPVCHLDELWPGYTCCRLFTTRDKLNANRDAYVAAVKANIKAYSLIQQDREKTLELAKHVMEIEDDVLTSQVYDYGHLGLNPSPDVKNITKFYEAMVEIGYAQGGIDFSEHVDASLYIEALDELLAEEPDNEVYKQLKTESDQNNK